MWGTGKKEIGFLQRNPISRVDGQDRTRTCDLLLVREAL
jgi:hypothetical protein